MRRIPGRLNTVRKRVFAVLATQCAQLSAASRTARPRIQRLLAATPQTSIIFSSFAPAFNGQANNNKGQHEMGRRQYNIKSLHTEGLLAVIRSAFLLATRAATSPARLPQV